MAPLPRCVPPLLVEGGRPQVNRSVTSLGGRCGPKPTLSYQKQFLVPAALLRKQFLSKFVFSKLFSNALLHWFILQWLPPSRLYSLVFQRPLPLQIALCELIERVFTQPFLRRSPPRSRTWSRQPPTAVSRPRRRLLWTWIREVLAELKPP